MAKSSGANPTRTGEIYMVNHNFDGVAISTTNNVNKGISILNNNIENGLAVVVGIDYKAKQQHNLDKSQIKVCIIATQEQHRIIFMIQVVVKMDQVYQT